MRRSRFSEEQVIGILKEHEAGPQPRATDLLRVSTTEFYRCTRGGMTVREIRVTWRSNTGLRDRRT